MTDAAISFTKAIPYNAHLGLEGTDVLALVLTNTLTNHVGTMHAGALFSLGEAASGLAAARELSDLFGGALVVTRTASIAFKKPARGTITAKGTLAEPSSGIRERLDRDGRVTFDVTVSLGDEDGVEVATMNVAWYAKKT